MKKYRIFLMVFFFSITMNAQNIYIDVTTTAMLKVYSDNLKNKQKETIEQQTKLQPAQVWVAAQMAVANSIQNKVYKGLKEVSGTLQNGIQVMTIFQELDQCSQYASDISNIVTTHPQYAVFGAKATQKTYEQVLKIGTDVTDILATGDLNLATAGDRHRLLHQISQNVTRLKLWLITIKLNLERAKRLGFWKSINPFQGYINTDKAIVQSIVTQYKHNF